MNRSLFPSGCVVRSNDLTYAQDQVALDTRVATDLTGIASGLLVTRNTADSGQFDISVGYGFTPTGERVALTSAVTAQTFGPPGTRALIALVYSELNTLPAPHETNNIPQYRRAIANSRVRVFTNAEWAALPATSTNLAVDSQDRALILAVGTRAASGDTSLTLSLARDRTDTKIVALRAQNSTFTLPGVNILAVSSNTINSDPFPSLGVTAYGFLRLVRAGSGATYTWSYGAPQDTGYGTGQTSTGQQTLTLASATTAYTLTIEVSNDLTYDVDGTYTEQFLVSNFYVPNTLPRLASSADAEHRALLGSVAPSATNPHGLALEDIAQPFDSIPGQLQRGATLRQNTAVASGNTPTDVWPTWVGLAPALASSIRYELLTELSGGNAEADAGIAATNIRIYRDQFNGICRTYNARWDNSAQLWYPDTAHATLGSMIVRERAREAGSDPIWQVQTHISTGVSWAESAWGTVLGNQVYVDGLGRVVGGGGVLGYLETDFVDLESNHTQTASWSGGSGPIANTKGNSGARVYANSTSWAHGTVEMDGAGSLDVTNITNFASASFPAATTVQITFVNAPPTGAIPKITIRGNGTDAVTAVPPGPISYRATLSGSILQISFISPTPAVIDLQAGGVAVAFYYEVN